MYMIDYTRSRQYKMSLFSNLVNKLEIQLNTISVLPSYTLFLGGKYELFNIIQNQNVSYNDNSRYRSIHSFN